MHSFHKNKGAQVVWAPLCFILHFALFFIVLVFFLFFSLCSCFKFIFLLISLFSFVLTLLSSFVWCSCLLHSNLPTLLSLVLHCFMLCLVLLGLALFYLVPLHFDLFAQLHQLVFPPCFCFYACVGIVGAFTTFTNFLCYFLKVIFPSSFICFISLNLTCLFISFAFIFCCLYVLLVCVCFVTKHLQFVWV